MPSERAKNLAEDFYCNTDIGMDERDELAIAVDASISDLRDAAAAILNSQDYNDTYMESEEKPLIVALRRALAGWKVTE